MLEAIISVTDIPTKAHAYILTGQVSKAKDQSTRHQPLQTEQRANCPASNVLNNNSKPSTWQLNRISINTNMYI